MELIRGLHNLQPHHRGCVATIGKFDGVHLGHRAVLAQLSRHAERLGLPAVVIVFEPQPGEFFAPEKAPPRLTRFRHKYELLKTAGLDRLMCLSFNRALCSMSAEQFIQQVLLDGLGVQHFVIGDDFRFGSDRAGDFELLQQFGKQHGFGVERTQTHQCEGQRVSSSRVRDSLQNNALADAGQLLGRPYSIKGKVVVGQQLGRTLGVPTANIKMLRYTPPLRGVYAIEAHSDERSWQGVANIGLRPTVGGTRPVLEAHLFDYSGDLYGSQLDIRFSQFIRPEQKFAGLDELKAAIAADIELARQYFAGQQMTDRN